MSIELSDKQFKKVSNIIYRSCGINLKDGKEALVRARLMKRLRALRMESIDGYLKYIESDEGARELGFMIDVMIYFDRPTQQKLVGRFWDFLVPGGYLFVGHSEGLSGVSHKFTYVQPATYKK